MEKLIRINDNYLSVTYFTEPAGARSRAWEAQRNNRIYASGNILELLKILIY